MMGVRQDVADVLEAQLTQPVAVYSYPVEVPILPAVVVVPDGGQYVTPLTFGRDGRASVVLVNLRISILEQRSEPSTAIDALEARRKEVTDAMKEIAGAQWTGFVDVGEATVNDIPALGGTVTVSIRMGDEQV